MRQSAISSGMYFEYHGSWLILDREEWNSRVHYRTSLMYNYETIKKKKNVYFPKTPDVWATDRAALIPHIKIPYYHLVNDSEFEPCVVLVSTVYLNGSPQNSGHVAAGPDSSISASCDTFTFHSFQKCIINELRSMEWKNGLWFVPKVPCPIPTISSFTVWVRRRIFCYLSIHMNEWMNAFLAFGQLLCLLSITVNFLRRRATPRHVTIHHRLVVRPRRECFWRPRGRQSSQRESSMAEAALGPVPVPLDSQKAIHSWVPCRFLPFRWRGRIFWLASAAISPFCCSCCCRCCCYCRCYCYCCLFCVEDCEPRPRAKQRRRHRLDWPLQGVY